MGEVVSIVIAVILGPIAIAWGALAFFLFMSDADKSNQQGDLFDDE